MADEVTVKAIQITTEQIGDSTEPIKKLAASLKRLRDTLSGSWVKTSADGMHNLADAFATIGDNAEKLERAADAIERIKKATGKVNKTMSQVMSNTAAGAATVTEKLTEAKPPEQGKGGAGKIKEVSESTDKAKKSAEKASNAFTKLFSSLKRIAVYRAIRTALSALANSAKQGLDNYYQFSKNTGGGLSTAMDNLKQSSTFVTNAFGAVIGSLVEKLEPVISWLLDGIAELFNKISATMAVMSNQSTYTAAKKGMIEYAKSAEAAKRALMGFDEINQIALDRSQINDYGKFFETRSTSPNGNAAAGIIQWIKDVIEILKPIANDYLPVIKDVLVWAKDILGKLQPMLSSFANLIDSLYKLFQPLVDSLIQIFGPVVKWLIEALTDVLNWVNTSLIPYFADKIGDRRLTHGETFEDILDKILGRTTPHILDVIQSGVAVAVADVESRSPLNGMSREALNGLTTALKEDIGWRAIDQWVSDERGTGYQYAAYATEIEKAIKWAKENGYLEEWMNRLKKFPNLNLTGYANGGSPLSGSLFYAGEAGPELVANVGGTSNVLNEAQIANAMYIAMSRALSENGGDTAVTLRLDGDAIYRNVIKRNSNQARSTGVSPFMA